MRPSTHQGARRLLPALALGFACSTQASPGADPIAWLARAAQASRQVSFEGIYVHTNGDRTSTVRVSHVNNSGEEHERIEPLDGASLDIVRRNDEMFCRFPDAKTVRLDPRITNRFFPGILSAPAETIAASYEVKLGKTERVLGFECQWIHLHPRDDMRFAQRLCSEIGTGLIVRAKVLNLQKQVIEQYTFTDLRVGPQAVARGELNSLFRARSRQWVSDGQPRDESASAETGWTVARPPAGFQKVTEIKRTMPGRPQQVSQIVLTDGVASISVFVEPAAPARAAEAFSEDGTTSFFARPMGEQLVTVLGEVPLATAQHVARSVTRRP